MSTDEGSASSPGDRGELATRAFAQGLAAAAGLGIGGPLGVIAAAVSEPYIESFLTNIRAKLSSDLKQRHAATLAAAQEALGVDFDELEERACATDASRLQTAIALSAATRTTWPPKVIALGRVLASGLMATDDTKIDTHPFIMAALGEIEFPHASLLDLLVNYWPRITNDVVVAKPYTQPDTAWSVGMRMWTQPDVIAVRPTLTPVLPSLLGTLYRHGLAIQSGETSDPLGRRGRAMRERYIDNQSANPDINVGATPGYPISGSWLPTELGKLVIDTLLEAGADFAQPPLDEPEGSDQGSPGSQPT